MVRFLAENKEEFSVRLADLHSLEDAGIAGADLARRPLNQEHVETLVMSDPADWPAITLAKAEKKGYIIVDGYHRKEAMRLKGMSEIRATSHAYADENAVIEACFEANLHHGLKLGQENRSNYAYWLHLTYPDMQQEEIARRAGIKQSTVSKAIARREARTVKAGRTAGISAEGEEEQQEQIDKACRKLTQDAIKLFHEIEDLPEREQRAAITESFQSVEDREALLKIATLLEQILKPRTRRTAKKPALATR